MLKPDPQTLEGLVHWRGEVVRRAKALMDRHGYGTKWASKLIFKNSRRLDELIAGGVTRLRASTIEQALERLDDLEKEKPSTSAKETADHGERTQQT